jgi:hypothetical protein
VNIALIILATVLSLGAAASAIGKFSKRADLVTQLTGLGVPEKMIPVLGLLEVAGVAGLIVGIWFAPIGVAAAAGLTLYFAGAVIAHVRHHDSAKDITPALVLFLVSVATLALEIAR